MNNQTVYVLTWEWQDSRIVKGVFSDSQTAYDKAEKWNLVSWQNRNKDGHSPTYIVTEFVLDDPGIKQ